MGESTGEGKFVPKPLERSDRVAVKPPSRLRQFIRNNTLGLGAFVAALGISGVVATGNTENAVDTIGSGLGDIAQVGLTDAEAHNNSIVKERLNAQGKKFGDPKESAIATDPESGKDGIVWRHGSIGAISYSGTVGVEEKMQDLIIHSEANTEGHVVSVDELKKLDPEFDPNNIWMTDVVGGPYDVNDSTDVKPGDWAEFNVGGKKFFAAEKFAKFDGKNQLRINASDQVVAMPSTPPGKE